MRQKEEKVKCENVHSSEGWRFAGGKCKDSEQEQAMKGQEMRWEEWAGLDPGW